MKTVLENPYAVMAANPRRKKRRHHAARRHSRRIHRNPISARGFMPNIPELASVGAGFYSANAVAKIISAKIPITMPDNIKNILVKIVWLIVTKFIMRGRYAHMQKDVQTGVYLNMITGIINSMIPAAAAGQEGIMQKIFSISGDGVSETGELVSGKSVDELLAQAESVNAAEQLISGETLISADDIEADDIEADDIEADDIEADDIDADDIEDDDVSGLIP
jgi:hypothetical protein